MTDETWKRPEELTAYDFVDTIMIPDGYDMKLVPDITRENFNKLIDEHNNLVRVITSFIEVVDENFGLSD